MALNPSNRLDVGFKGYPTRGDPPFIEKCKDQATAELRDAGLPRGSETLTLCEREVYKQDSDAHKMASAGIHMPGMATPDDMEWVWLYSVEAKAYGYKFDRAWYYWIVRTKSKEHYIPQSAAEEFNEKFGKEVRVDGFAGGQDVRGDVSGYHVDTVRGLAALVEMLKKHDADIDAKHREEWGLPPR
jgi:hypothetical protein